MKKISLLIFILALAVVFTTSCCPAARHEEKPVVKKQAPVEKAAKVEEPVFSGQGCDVCSLIKVVASAPKEAVIGQTYQSDVDVTALQHAGEVKLITRIPPNLKYVKSEPPATVEGNKLVWDLGSMNKDQVRKIQVWWTPEQEGKHWICYVAMAFPRYCVDTLVGKPMLAISKQGPATANLNQEITYTVVVQNKGTAVARGVVVTDQIPEGLVHTSGKNTLTFEVGDLAPNASKSFNVPVKAMVRGNVCNVAFARSSNAGEVSDKACTQIMKKDVVVSLNCPQNGLVGTRSNVNFGVQNTGDTSLTKVVVELEYPAAVKVLQSDCTTNVMGNKVVWNIGELKAGAQVNCNQAVVADVEGNHCVKLTLTCAEGITQTANCCTLWKGVPKLEITKTAPPTAKLDSEFTYNIVVKNVGTGVAKNVKVVDPLPSQVNHPRGAELQYTIGDLNPNDSRTIQIPVKAVNTGEANNCAKAMADNAEPVQACAKTVIQKQSAQLALNCSEEMFVGKRGANRIVLTNTGDIALTNVVITAMWSSQLTLVAAEGNPNVAGNQAVWNVASLAPRTEKVISVEVMSKFAGKHCMQVSAVSAEGINEKVECCTLWKGFPALLLEVIDTEDPLLMNEETTYVIEVTNQGTALDRQVQIVAIFPAETNPVQVAGDTQGSIQGKRVVFAPYPVLEPKQKIKFTIRARAASKGDSRLTVEMSSELLQKPVKEEESTQVY
ncbi:MAG: DUF11 domain-containing protein [Candidatus Brocadiae bacterium]|nr:DUF11 domain-containing protein [Candidatus Brocadiia bacterium]